VEGWLQGGDVGGGGRITQEAEQEPALLVGVGHGAFGVDFAAFGDAIVALAKVVLQSFADLVDVHVGLPWPGFWFFFGAHPSPYD